MCACVCASPSFFDAYFGAGSRYLSHFNSNSYCSRMWLHELSWFVLRTLISSGRREPMRTALFPRLFVWEAETDKAALLLYTVNHPAPVKSCEGPTAFALLPVNVFHSQCNVSLVALYAYFGLNFCLKGVCPCTVHNTHPSVVQTKRRPNGTSVRVNVVGQVRDPASWPDHTKSRVQCLNIYVK